MSRLDRNAWRRLAYGSRPAPAPVPGRGVLFWAALLALLALVCVVASRAAVVTLTDEVLLADMARFGVNVGGPNDYGAENYLSNLVMNPGFEPGEWGSVISTRGSSSPTTVLQADYWSTTWNTATVGWPVGHWTGARWELPLQGLSGVVQDFTHAGNRYTWVLDQAVTASWHEPLYVRRVDAPSAHGPRPGSAGVQSRWVASPGNSWETVGKLIWDSLARQGDARAGTMRQLRGPHELRFWGKGPAVVDFRLERYPDGPMLLEAPFTLDGEWREYSVRFEPADPLRDGLAPMLSAGWRFRSGAGIWLDDMYLGPADAPSHGFTAELESALRSLRPGVLRFWQGIQGDSLANLLAEPHARRPREYRPRLRRATAYGYGLREALALSRAVDASPWLVLPPTLTLSEWRFLGDWLRLEAEDFPEVFVEFGNEGWGSNNPGEDPFAGASFDGGARIGACASRAFAALGEIPNVRLVVGGQAAWAGQNEAIRAMVGGEVLIPVAPYFGVLKKESAGTLEEKYYPLYARAFEDLTPLGKAWQTSHVSRGVYEINFHTTGGAGGAANVNPFVAGQAGGLALPLYMLQYAVGFGWSPQAAFVLTQHNAGDIYIWGLYRDIMATGRARPTGLALGLVNRAVRGDLVRVVVEDAPEIAVPAVNGLAGPVRYPGLVAYGWRSGRSWSVALFNLRLDASEGVTGLPSPSSAWLLSHEDPEAMNEAEERVRVWEMDWQGVVPGHSLVVLEGEFAESDPAPEPDPVTLEVRVPSGVGRVVLELD